MGTSNSKVKKSKSRSSRSGRRAPSEGSSSSEGRWNESNKQKKGTEIAMKPMGRKRGTDPAGEQDLAVQQGCLWEETFYPKCHGKGHSTIRCLQKDPHHICEEAPPGQARWGNTSTKHKLCPKCQDFDCAKRLLSNRDYYTFIGAYGHSYSRQPHRKNRQPLKYHDLMAMLPVPAQAGSATRLNSPGDGGDLH